MTLGSGRDEDETQSTSVGEVVDHSACEYRSATLYKVRYADTSTLIRLDACSYIKIWPYHHTHTDVKTQVETNVTAFYKPNPSHV